MQPPEGLPRSILGSKDKGATQKEQDSRQIIDVEDVESGVLEGNLWSLGRELELPNL